MPWTAKPESLRFLGLRSSFDRPAAEAVWIGFRRCRLDLEILWAFGVPCVEFCCIGAVYHDDRRHRTADKARPSEGSGGAEPAMADGFRAALPSHRLHP